MSFDAEAFGAAVGEIIREAVMPLHARIDGMQAKLDKCMTYAGEHQTGLDYGRGSLVRRDGGVYLAVKAVKAGSAFSAREGSGWERII